MDYNDVLKRTAVGLVGGVAGLAAMQLYWKAATALSGRDPRKLTRDAPPKALDDLSVAGKQHRTGESSTAAVGRKAYEAVTGEAPPSKETKAALSYGVHWSYGLAMGGLYGALRGGAGVPDAVGGLLFGTALWLLGDELLVPVLGLSEGPTAYPPEQHAHRLGAHLAYGLATATAAQALYDVATPRRTAWDVAKTYLKWKP